MSDLTGIISGMGGLGESIETKLLRLLAEQKRPLSAGFIEWLVTGHRPEPALRYDIVHIPSGQFLPF